MPMNWLRWHHGTANDPKWRVVSKITGVPIAYIGMIWAGMMESASQNEQNRGTLSGWKAEDIAASLDCETEWVEKVYQAFQGRTLDGNRLIQWEKRNPKREREDDSSQRVKRHREQKKAKNGHVTPRNTKNALDKIREEKIRKEGERGVSTGVDPAPATPEKMFEIFNANCGDMPKPQELTDSRRAKCNTRIRQYDKTPGKFLARFEEAVKSASTSPFCLGKNDRGWKMNFDFLIDNDKNMLKLLEGNYANDRARTGHQAFIEPTETEYRSGELGHLFEPDHQPVPKV